MQIDGLCNSLIVVGTYSTCSTDYYQRITLKSWFTNLEQTALNRCQPLPAPYKRLLNRKQ